MICFVIYQKCLAVRNIVRDVCMEACTIHIHGGEKYGRHLVSENICSTTYSTLLLIVCWFITDCLLVYHWLFVGLSLIVCWFITDCLLVYHWLFVGLSLIVCWFITDCLLVYHWLFVVVLLIGCWFITDLLLDYYWLFDVLLLSVCWCIWLLVDITCWVLMSTIMLLIVHPHLFLSFGSSMSSIVLREDVFILLQFNFAWAPLNTRVSINIYSNYWRPQ